MSGHTPGPWELGEDDDGHVIRMGSALKERGLYQVHHIIEYSHGLECSEPFAGKEEVEAFAEAEADARLIAAAPDLLLAARMMVEAPHDGARHHAYAALVEAIAKAEGRTAAEGGAP